MSTPLFPVLSFMPSALLVMRLIGCLIFWACLDGTMYIAHARVPPPITSSGLNEQVNGPINIPSGKVQFDITGGTRPGGGPNLVHSFGDLNVPTTNIANFLNGSGLATSNIFGRVTEGAERPGLDDPTSETTVLSLRRIAPARFLTQTFVFDESASCQS